MGVPYRVRAGRDRSTTAAAGELQREVSQMTEILDAGRFEGPGLHAVVGGKGRGLLDVVLLLHGVRLRFEGI
jgi:hypothetical protein